MKLLNLTVAFIFFILLTGCSDENEHIPPDTDNQNIQVLSFNFLADNNSSISEDIIGEINEDQKKIYLNLPFNTSVTSLVPTITITNGAEIIPDNNTAQDFSSPVIYLLSKDGYDLVAYSVIVTLGEEPEESDASILNFSFLKENNVSLSDNYEAVIENNEIRLKVPEGTDITNLIPEILLSDEAEVSPLSGTPQNFSNPVTYNVTAEDGSEKEYIVYVSFLSSSELDRFFLEEFYRANERYNTPYTYLNWDLEAPTMENWNGVTIVDGRVSELVIASVRINEIPESIKYLNKLRVLTIAGRTLASIPAEIGSLETLEILILDDNRLTTIPKEIGNLPSIRGIYLKNNLLEELPSEIGNLPDSFYVLNIKGNNLQELPVEISNIPNLISLNIQDNPLTIIPQVICDMTTSNGAGISIVKDVEDECM